ncbi:MAG: RecX family transcriptional regulator [Chloroflexota bacterium]|nr:RecX family transcriptional regulator [Chloroflexota bacterium]
MNEITAVRVGRGRGKRVNVFLNGRFAFSLEAEVAVKEDLRVGRELSASHIEALTRTDQFQRCLNAASRYLSYRPRSEAELRERLSRRGFDSDSIEKVINRFKEQRLVDDAAFAQFWKENRETFSPRSRRLTKLELKRKGVAEEIIDQVVDVVDDDSAYRAALSKARRLPVSDYPGFRRRLGSYLQRRGFSYAVTEQMVARLWREMSSLSPAIESNQDERGLKI